MTDNSNIRPESRFLPAYSDLKRPQNRRSSRRAALHHKPGTRERAIKRAMARAVLTRAKRKEAVQEAVAARQTRWDEHFRAGGTHRNGRPCDYTEYNPPSWDPGHVDPEDILVWVDKYGKAAAQVNVALHSVEEAEHLASVAEEKGWVLREDWEAEHGED